MKTPIVLLVGNAGSGKDTIADKLVDIAGPKVMKIAQADPIKQIVAAVFGASKKQLWGPSKYRNEKIKIDAKKCAEKAVNLHLTNGRVESVTLRLASALNRGELAKTATVRHLCQYIGTELGRAYDPNVWLDVALDTANKLLTGGYTYTPDKGLSECDSSRVDLVIISDGRFRNEVLGVGKAGGITVRVHKAGVLADSHQSEVEVLTIPSFWFDYAVENFGTLDDLHTMSMDLLDSISGSCKTIDRYKLQRWNIALGRDINEPAHS
jgi:predicted kinase